MAEYIDREKIREETCKGCVHRTGKDGCGWPEPCEKLIGAFLNAEPSDITYAIDPESLPIVQELRAELKRAAVEPLSHFDRSKWKPCKRCGDEDMLRMWEQWGRQYCTHCGRPLTDAAWEMMEKRLDGVK